MDNRPIGVFDSGLGGLTVLKAINQLMPAESIIYFGDSGRAPYGTKSKETVVKYTFQDINFLLGHDIKMIVIACNTASAYSLDTVKEHFTIPVMEVVQPGAKAAVDITTSGKIGVIGTPATINSAVYEKAIKNFKKDATYLGKACPMFVQLAEEGWWDNEIAYLIAQEYLSSLKNQGIDTLILGCTHYPFLQNVIQKVMGDDVTLVNSALEVARAVKELIYEKKINCDSTIPSVVKYFTSDSVDKFRTLGSIFLGHPMNFVEKADIEKY